jgi:tyrosyl-tRNA synthetase
LSITTNVFEILEARGYVEQLTHEEEIKHLFSTEPVTFYIGFDPTADSLHVGHFIQIMVMRHMQQAGHRPIALLGGGTTMVGDPSGRTDMRKMLTQEDINHNAEKFKVIFSKFLDFSDDKAMMVNNADWLLDLNYIEFLREIGAHFSINKMITADSYKNRMETGLTFLEFNYMIMQAYDFYVLNEKYNAKMQLGGNDQWSNIIAGVELIRRKAQKSAYGMTFALLVNSEGVKMGKTAKGALWLDPDKTSPYEFYQYWRNVEDADVEKCLSLLTTLPMDEVKRLSSLKDEKINEAKEVLAYEVTALVHSEEDAKKAQASARALFGGEGVSDDMPTLKADASSLSTDIVTFMLNLSLASSKSEARRLIEQGGLTINGQRVDTTDRTVESSDFVDDTMVVRKGKKNYYKVLLKNE